jgi:hypothetical protein
MTERETLLAEIAERQARLAEIDAEPDWEAWKPLVREIISMYHTTRLSDADVATHILGKPSVRGLIAALPKAPPMGECQPRWPSEAELRETKARFYAPCACGLVDVCGYHRSKQFYEDSRRIRAYQTGEQP